MLVFIDTEFTCFKHAELISLALVSEDGREMYVEATDYNRAKCNPFVVDHVLPILGRVSGAACDRTQMTERVREWFEQLPEPATVIYDFGGDWYFLTQVVSWLPAAVQDPPANMAEKLALGSATFTHPIFEKAAAATFSEQWPQHHALADARALMAGYRAWREFMEPIWKIK